MLYLIFRRLLGAVPVLFFVAFFIFSLLHLSPGDPAAIIAGDAATSEDVERLRVALGLDRPFLIQFGSWLWNVAHGDLGLSIYSRVPVTDLIGQRLEPTLSLVGCTILLSIIVAVPLGVMAAERVGSGLDRIVMSGAVLGFSVPVFVVGYVLSYTFALKLGWFPVLGYKPLSGGLAPWLRSLTLPTLSMAFVYIALIARVTRASMIDALGQDYIRTARAKGVGQKRILYVHALKNAGISIATVIGIGIAMLIGGAVVIESVFAIPGIGRLVVDAILRRDYPVIQGVVLFSSFAYVLINLLIDIAYTIIDPRIRY